MRELVRHDIEGGGQWNPVVATVADVELVIVEENAVVGIVRIATARTRLGIMNDDREIRSVSVETIPMVDRLEVFERPAPVVVRVDGGAAVGREDVPVAEQIGLDRAGERVRESVDDVRRYAKVFTFGLAPELTILKMLLPKRLVVAVTSIVLMSLASFREWKRTPPARFITKLAVSRMRSTAPVVASTKTRGATHAPNVVRMSTAHASTAGASGSVATPSVLAFFEATSSGASAQAARA